MSSLAAHQPLSEAVVERVAEADNTDPMNLTPLYEVIDPDALDSLFSPTSTDQHRDGQVSFRYCGYMVVVDSTGDIGIADEDPSFVEQKESSQD